MLGRRVYIIFGLALLSLIGVLWLDAWQPFAYVRLRNLYRDAVCLYGRKAPANPNLVFLGIDAASVNLDATDVDEVFGLRDSASDEGRALRLMTRRFPWSREVYALILQRLVTAGAKVVTFDLTFPSFTDDDAAFRAALDRYSDHVVVGSNFVDGSLTRPSETLIAQTKPIDDRIGYTNFWADDDDVVRSAQYQTTFEQVRGATAQPDPERFRSLAAEALIKAGFAKDVPDDLNARSLRFTALPREGFPAHSLFEIFVPAFWKQNYQSGEFFKDKIVIVGAEGNWQHDDHPTPLGRMPGAELHLNAMNAALHNEFIRELPSRSRAGLTILAAALGIVVSFAVRSPWLRIVALSCFWVGGIALGLAVFNCAACYLPMVAPLAEFTATVLLGLVCDFTLERMEKTRVRRVLERYMSRDVVHEMVDSPAGYTAVLGGVVRPVAILFSDIRAYSSVTAQSSPSTLVAQLNEYFTAMVDCVFQFGGTVDKFIGDALMAVWGSLRSKGPGEDAIAAVNAALAMQKRLAALNRDWRERGWPQLRVGTAINCGEVVAGNIGSPQRMEFTVIGDAVNVSWKLQEMTKKVDAKLIVSGTVAALVAEHFELRSLGPVAIDKSHLSCEIFTVERPIQVFEGAALAHNADN